MLPLNDVRWRSLSTFCHSGDELPGMIRRWQAAVGADDAETIWNEVRDSFLHQSNITEAAYAVLPYMMCGLSQIESDRRLTYLVDLGVSEWARLQTTAPPIPPSLAEPYHAAVKSARPFAIELLPRAMSPVEFRWLVGVVCSVHGHSGLADLLFNLDCVCGDCPKCGESIYPEEIQASGYV